MNINDLFPSKYLKASDLQGREVRVTIERIEQETVGQDLKGVMYFQGKTKGLVLNRCNGECLASLFGPETDAWLGKTIRIRPDRTTYRGHAVDCLRVGPDATPTDGSHTF